MKKNIIVFCMLIVCVFVIGGCGANKVPDEKKLAEMLPHEIINYEYESDLRECTVSSFEIIRRQTNEKSDTADCQVILEDDKIKRTVYITLHSNYYDKGGWQLDSWEFFDEEETGVPKADYGEENVLAELQERGYQTANKTFEEFDPLTGYCSYVYEVNEKSKYLTISGTIVVKAHLVKIYTMDNSQNMTDYRWEKRIDTDSTEMVWDVDGTWTGENYGFGKKGHFEVSIDLLDDGEVDASGAYYWPSTEGGEGSYECKSASYEMEGDSPQTAKLTVRISYTYPGGKLIFTANDVHAEIGQTEFVNIQKK